VLNSDTGAKLQTIGTKIAPSAVAYSKDNLWLAAGDDDGDIRVFDATTGQETQSLVGHQKKVLQVSFLEGNFLASVSADGTVRLWDLALGRQILVLFCSDGIQVPKCQLLFPAMVRCSRSTPGKAGLSCGNAARRGPRNRIVCKGPLLLSTKKRGLCEFV
jgi:WD40 repeat protein